jgi:hypothetical protein
MKNILTDFSCEDCFKLLEVKENADKLIANPRDFAIVKIEGKEYILMTRLQLLAAIEYIEKLENEKYLKNKNLKGRYKNG